jgi:hypothetical protein
MGRCVTVTGAETPMVRCGDMAAGAWTLAIDFGARTTRAAVVYHTRGRIAVVDAVPSVVRWHVSDTEAPPGELRAGNPWATLRASRWRGEFAPKGRVGEQRLALEIIVSLTSAGSITALVSALKAWLDRESQHRTIDGEIGGKHFHIDANGVSDGTIQAALERALSESTET